MLYGCGGSGTSVGGGGGGGNGSGDVTGTVFDIDDNVVRDARVFVGSRETRTSTTGTYAIQGVPSGEIRVQAEVRQNGVSYRGQTYTLVFDGDQTNNANIVVGANDEMGSLQGVVRDRDGNLLEGVSVFADGGAGSSARVFTSREGRYAIQDLIGGVTYTVKASAVGYRGDTETIQIRRGETRTVNFVMGDPGSGGIGAPTGLDVTTWVSPTDARNAVATGSAIEWIKQLYDPRRANRKKIRGSRTINALRNDLLVEADLYWDADDFSDHIGWGVYRATNNGSLLAYDYLADPLVPYYVDVGLNTRSRYDYGVTSLASARNGQARESDLSDRVSVDTLDLLRLNSVSRSPLTFRWTAASGATKYVVYVFADFPSIGQDPVWSNSNSPTNGTSLVYNGGSLQSGRTYYYMVLGLTSDNSGRSISAVGSFTP